jgi:integrase
MRELFAFCGQPGLTSHSWHRTAATIMEPDGLSARAGADRLGHRQVGTTMNHYWGRCVGSTGAAQVPGSLAF